MIKRFKILMLLAILATTLVAFTACAEDLVFGEYEDVDGRLTLILSEDSAQFGTKGDVQEYYVNYWDCYWSTAGNEVGINDDYWDCFWGVFDYTFVVQEDGTLILKGYESDSTEVDIVLVKQYD